MTTHSELQQHVRKRLLGLAVTIVVVTVIAVGVLGTAMTKAAKKLPVDPYVLLAGTDAGSEAPEPPPPRAGDGDGVLSGRATFRRRLSRLRYRDERQVRRFLEEQHATGRDADQIRMVSFLDDLDLALEEDERIEVKRAVVAVYRRLPAETLRDDRFGAFLVDPDAEMRRLAVMGYGAHSRDEHWEAIAGLSEDIEPSVREAVAMSLRGVRHDASVDVLVALLVDEHDEVVAACGLSLGHSLGRELPIAFLDACGHERAAVRLAVAEALSIARGRAAAPLLTRLLQDPDWRVRRTAVRGLARMRGPAAEGAARALSSVAAQVGMPRTDRFEALQALAAMPELPDSDRLRRVAMEDADPVLRLVAARAALAHGDVSVCESLIQLLRVDEGENCDDEDRIFVRAAAESTLREALLIEGPEGANYTEQAARASLRKLKPETLDYSPTRMFEFW